MENKLEPGRIEGRVEKTPSPIRGRIAAFAIGIAFAWLGLPAAIHLAYWGAILIAGLCGYWIGHR